VKAATDTSKTILVITTGFLVIYVVKSWNGDFWSTLNRDWAIWLALIIGILSILSFWIEEKIAWLWLQLGYVLGLIVPKLILSLIFFLVLSPVALLSKVFGKKNALQLKDTQDSLFKTVDKTFDPKSFEKPW